MDVSSSQQSGMTLPTTSNKPVSVDTPRSKRNLPRTQKDIIKAIKMKTEFCKGCANKICRLTRKVLMQREDWADWQKSEEKQLDAYDEQKMFSEPCELPPNANVLNLLWVYLVKVDGTKKARCVCNGCARMKGSVTLGYTYAGSLEQTGARIFWATTALRNYIAVGADVSNAFAEAPAPKAPLYVYMDRQFREWYQKKYKRNIPRNCNVVRVLKALQGHPESPRLWYLLINDILLDLGLKPCNHEPCLYSGTFNGKDVLFLRQVDDFAISAADTATCTELINTIQSRMTMSVHELGVITWFNGVDVEQGSTCVRISSKTYLKKIISNQKWLDKNDRISNLPLPSSGDTKYVKTLEEAIPPNNDLEREELQREMGFKYRQAVGELIYAMITTRPDISFPLVKLSQYSCNPAREHYKAIKDIFLYLRSTVHEGITYWRKEKRDELPDIEISLPKEDNYTPVMQWNIEDGEKLFGSADATWGEDKNHRKSVSGMVLMLAGGTIYYKSCFQKSVSLSSTEAEFMAANEAGKAILYVRSILQDIGLHQCDATTLYEDNAGAVFMGNARQPTRRTRHMDIRVFSLQEWIERDLIVMKSIPTSSNYADAMTKNLNKILFYRHFDYIMGRRRPSYAVGIDIRNRLSRVDADSQRGGV